MKIFLIVFELFDRNRINDMIGAIKEYGSWARICSNSWCIKVSDKTAADVRDSLSDRIPLQNTDRLLVVNITNSAWASYYLPKDVAEWLKEKS